MSHTTLVQAAQARAFVDALLAAPIIAVDTEFHGEKTWSPELFLFQVATSPDQAWIVDPLDATVVGAVSEAMRTRQAWIVHAGWHDLRLLERLFGGLPGVVHDTQIAAGLVADVYPAGLARLLDLHLGVKLPKSATLSDWSRRPLDPEQLRYAADDVLHLHALWAALSDRARALGREALVDAACAEAREAIREPWAAEAWRDALGASVSDPREAARVRALWTWRERLAQAQDKPARTLLSDHHLRHLAKVRPRNANELFAQRRLPGGFVKSHAHALLDAMHTAENEPPEAMPWLLAPGTPAARLSSLLRLAADCAGRDGSFAGSLAVPPLLRDAIAVQAAALGAPPALAPVLGPWRDALVGSTLADVLSGRTSVTFVDMDAHLLPAQYAPPKPASPRSDHNTPQPRPPLV
jgi:ribonuclease D